MGCLRVKPGVLFAQIAPAGFRLLGALERAARGVPGDVTITCGTDSHAETDPHTRGEAYDVRTHDLSENDKRYLLREVLIGVQENVDDAPKDASIGLATRYFYGQLEHPGEAGEHLHVQIRKGKTWPPTTRRINRNLYPRRHKRDKR